MIEKKRTIKFRDYSKTQDNSYAYEVIKQVNVMMFQTGEMVSREKVKELVERYDIEITIE